MGDYRLALAVEEDFRQILRYSVERWGIGQAEKYADALEECFSKIGDGEIVSRRFTGLADVYVVSCVRHYVFFLKKDPVEIIAILHERMDCIARLKHRLPE